MIMQDFLADFGKNLAYFSSFKLFAIYSNGSYNIKTPEEMYREIYSYSVKNHPGMLVSDHKVKDIYKQLEYGCERMFDTTSRDFIAFTDVLLSTVDFTTHPHDPDIPVIFSMPLNYQDVLKGDSKPFVDFLSSALVYESDNKDKDTELVNLMQELFGYMLMGHIDAEMAFFFVGDGANGKGVTTTILTEMLGPEYILSMSIETLTTRQFATSALVGKRLNISNEEESKFIRSDKLKTLISGDMTTAERKFGKEFQFMPTSKFIFCSNNMPTFDDLNYGLRRRFKIIPFFRSLKPEERDVNLRRKLKENMTGVVRWAIEGARRLQENDLVFSSPEATIVAAKVFENDSSSVLRYLRETYVPGDGEGESATTSEFVCYKNLYTRYRSWCEDVGKRPLQFYNFKKDMKRMDEYSGEATRGYCSVHEKRERGWTLSDVPDDEESETPPELKIPFEGSV